MNPLISVIVPNYNHELFLRQRLESVFNQTYLNFEVILLDDCSTDNSRDILLEFASHPKVSHCVFNEMNFGNTFKQWQKGILLAKGEYIWIAESDDYCELDFLEKVSKPLNNDNNVVLSYCQSKSVDFANKIIGSWLHHTLEMEKGIMYLDDFIMEGNDFIEHFLIFKNVIPNASAVIIRKSVIEIQKHLDTTPEFRYCGDWMFYFKLILNKKVAFIAEPLNNYRFHYSSAIANSKQNVLEIIEIEFKVRKILLEYLKNEKNQNFEAIKFKNKFVKRYYLNYEKAFSLVRKGDYLKGYSLLIMHIDVFFTRYNIRKNIKLKLRNLYKKK